MGRQARRGRHALGSLHTQQSGRHLHGQAGTPRPPRPALRNRESLEMGELGILSAQPQYCPPCACPPQGNVVARSLGRVLVVGKLYGSPVPDGRHACAPGSHLAARPQRVICAGRGGLCVTQGLPRHAWDSCKQRHKGVPPWTWPPLAHAASHGQVPAAQRLKIAQPPRVPGPAPRSRGHFRGYSARRTPAAQLSGDAEPVYVRNSGLFTAGTWILFLFIAYLIWRKSPRHR